MSDLKLDLRFFDEAADAPALPQAESTAPVQADVPVEAEEDSIDQSFVDDPAWQEYSRLQQARFQAKSAALARSCAQAAAIYPDFDLQREMRNPRFMRLIDAGLSVRESYEVLHRDDLLKHAVTLAAQKARQETYQSLAARKSRVEENGASSALVTKKNPASMSKSQREQIAKRVMRGEKVTF